MSAVWGVSNRLLGPKATAFLMKLYRDVRGFDPRDIGPAQSNEADLLDQLCHGVPETFCEFGFHLAEFNTGRLALRGWRGLLIDGDKRQVDRASETFGRAPHLPVTALHLFLNRENLRPTVEGHFRHNPLGVLSVDVDGNDYWFVADLLPLRPALVVTEYNTTFGLRPVTVPYDPSFNRHAKHPSGWYHGASITAFHSLCASADYRLVAVSDNSANLFFLRNDIGDAPGMLPADAYRESPLRNMWSGKTAEQQWEVINHLPLVQVSAA